MTAGVLTSPITANTKSDGSGTIGTDIVRIFTADPTNGSYVSSIRLSPYAIVANTTTTATVIRVFISSITAGATTSANTWLIQEISVGAQAASNPATATFFIEVPVNRPLPPSFTILVSQHAAAATNTGWHCVVFGGHY